MQESQGSGFYQAPVQARAPATPLQQHIRLVESPWPGSGLPTDGSAQQVGSSVWALLWQKAPTPHRTRPDFSIHPTCCPKDKEPRRSQILPLDGKDFRSEERGRETPAF